MIFKASFAAADRTVAIIHMLHGLVERGHNGTLLMDGFWSCPKSIPATLDLPAEPLSKNLVTGHHGPPTGTNYSSNGVCGSVRSVV